MAPYKCAILCFETYVSTQKITLIQIECNNIKQMKHYVIDSIFMIICEKKMKTKQTLSYTMHL